MDQLDNQKFGVFLASLRKEQGLTQKELAEKLFVSDKAVSKWERGASMPGIALLLPISQLFGITVSELLKGEREAKESAAQKEDPDPNALLTHAAAQRHKRHWRIAYFLCLVFSAAEIFLLNRLGMSWNALIKTILPMTFLLFVFGGWFCFFAKDLLPGYYDTNKINYVSQGIFRIHLSGLSIHNGNWASICTTIKFWALSGATLYPLFCLIIILLDGYILWSQLEKPILFALFAGMLLSVYWTGRKHS